MELFRDGLMRAKELSKKCKSREEIKKYITALNCLGKIS